MNPERLRTDHARIRELADENPALVSIVTATGSPPTQYVLALRCRGIASIRGEDVRYRDEHNVQVLLGPDYPYDQPLVQFLTPIVHPHVWTSNRVCLGDWTVSEFLDLLVIRLFRIVQYHTEILDESSVANLQAQAWVRLNRQGIPIGSVIPGEKPKEPIQPTITFRRTSVR